MRSNDVVVDRVSWFHLDLHAQLAEVQLALIGANRRLCTREPLASAHGENLVPKPDLDIVYDVRRLILDDCVRPHLGCCPDMEHRPMRIARMERKLHTYSFDSVGSERQKQSRTSMEESRMGAA